MTPAEMPGLVVQLARIWRLDGENVIADGEVDYRGPSPDQIADGVRRCAPIWVSAEFCRLVEAAARSYPDVPITADEVGEFPAGVAWLEAPLLMPFQNLKTGGREYLPVRAIGWAPARAREVDGDDREYRRGLSETLYADPDTHANLRTRPGANYPVIPYAPGLCPFGDVPPHGFEYLRTLLALLRQRIAARERAHLSRGQMRQAQRAGVIPDVQVITLRRPIAHDLDLERHEAGYVEWSHRWIVSGHWRRQWVPTVGAYVPTYIAPYVKGPADKPLVTDRAYALVR